MANNLFEFHKTSQEDLLNLFKEERISRTIAVAGPNGVGKKDFILDLVKSRFKKPNKIDKNIHPDCLIIDSTDGKILVDDLSELNSWSIKAPCEEVEKVLIINNIQDMNVVGQNKLLKIVEEPPEKLTIILISSNIDSLIPTLRSRTLQFNFKKLPDSIILDLIPERLHDTQQIILNLLDGSLMNLKFITQANLSLINNCVDLIVSKDFSSLDELNESMDQLAKETNTYFLLYSISNVISFRISSLAFNNKLEISYNLIDFNEGLLQLLSEIKNSNINIKINLDEIILNYFLN
jgi:DNA polymerase III delta prime subunit